MLILRELTPPRGLSEMVELTSPSYLSTRVSVSPFLPSHQWLVSPNRVLILGYVQNEHPVPVPPFL
jgi:hypothetical protein